MKNPLVEKVERELERLGFHGAKLVRESYSSDSFGNAQAMYQIDNLYINFIRDRGNDVIDLISAKPTNQKDLYNFDDLSILMGWESLDEMVRKYKYSNIDFTKPPPGPAFSLGEALQLIEEHYDELQRMFSPKEVAATLTKLSEVSARRSKALFE
jgi:hypothetical protein